MSITFDNASNNNVAVGLLKDSFHPILNSRLLHIRCACHIINLLVQLRINECFDIIRKIRYYIIFIMYSNSRIDDFYKFCKTSCYR